MRFDKQTIQINLIDKVQKRSTNEKIQERDDLIKRMGYKSKNVPFMVQNQVENVINPYYIAKMHSEVGFPKELTLEEIGKRANVDWKNYWSDWCEFWFDSFIKIPHNILCNSEEYYKTMKW